MRVFLTGCGSGFGLALTRRLLAAGHDVIGTEVSLGGVQQRVLGGLGPGHGQLELRVLDLLDPNTIAAATRHVGPVDVLVNNAGYALFGTLAETDLDAVDKLFRVNVLGLSRVSQALLPTLRERGGVVVQLSSVAGRMSFPESGFYAATKYAVEAMSEALFLENCTFGMRVVLIEPGSFNTGFLARAQAESEPRNPDSPYAQLHALWDASKRSVLDPPQDPELVVDAILTALDSDVGFLRVPVGGDSVRMLRLRDQLSPDAWVRLLAERNGGGPAGPPFAEPAQVLETRADALFATWPESVVAAREGHLEHWGNTEQGAAALQMLLG